MNRFELRQVEIGMKAKTVHERLHRRKWEQGLVFYQQEENFEVERRGGCAIQYGVRIEVDHAFAFRSIAQRAHSDEFRPGDWQGSSL